MNKEDVMEYFDRCAPHWDDAAVHDDGIIDQILDNAHVHAGTDVLDVACGTGILIPDYLRRGAASVTGVDLSQNMIAAAQRKFRRDNVRFLCADIEQTNLTQRFDCVVVYNAFPHFPDPRSLVKKLIGYLKPNGTLTVAHGMSREALARHHAGAAAAVSVDLIDENELALLFAPELCVTTKLSNDRMYQVAGVRIDAKRGKKRAD